MADRTPSLIELIAMAVILNRAQIEATDPADDTAEAAPEPGDERDAAALVSTWLKEKEE